MGDECVELGGKMRRNGEEALKVVTNWDDRNWKRALCRRKKKEANLALPYV